MGSTWDSGTQRCRYYVGLESFEKECFIRYYDDPDDDGLSDTSALMSKTFIMVEGVYGVLDYEIVTHIN